MQITIKIGNETKPVRHVKDIAKAAKADAKVDSTHKLNAHVVCIVIGIAITVACSFFNTSIILHISGILAASPAFIQEGIDWLRDW